MSNACVEYAVPRHTSIPSPSLGEVIAGLPTGKQACHPAVSEQVRLYQTGRVPPQGASLVDRGRLLALGRGFLFVATSHHPEWRESLAEAEDLAARGTAEAGLELAVNLGKPAPSAVTLALGVVMASCFIGETWKDAVKTRVNALAHRLASTSSCALPYVDIVAVRCDRAWSWSRLRSVRCTVLTLESDRGEIRRVCLAGPGARIADVWLERRIEQEVVLLAAQVWEELLGTRELWASFRSGYADAPGAVMGRVWDEWQARVEARIATQGVTGLRVAALTLKRLEPWLEHYRRIPSLASSVQAMEALVHTV